MTGLQLIMHGAQVRVHPAGLRSELFRKQCRRRMREWALIWREEVQANGRSEFAEDLISVAAGWREKSDVSGLKSKVQSPEKNLESGDAGCSRGPGLSESAPPTSSTTDNTDEHGY